MSEGATRTPAELVEVALRGGARATAQWLDENASGESDANDEDQFDDAIDDVPAAPEVASAVSPDTVKRGDAKPTGATWDTAEAIRFLRALDADGWHQLVEMEPDGALLAETFGPDEWDRIEAWIEQRQGRGLNLYFTLNEVRKNLDRRASKDDIVAVRAIHVDLDPAGGAAEFKAERKRLGSLLSEQVMPNAPPTLTVDSGGGAQLIWKLGTKLPAAENRAGAEAQAYGISKMLGGDSAHDASRLLRLPGTINYPNARKRAKGRVPARARFVATDHTYRLAQLAEWIAPVAAPEKKPDATLPQIDMDAVRSASSYDELSEGLRSKFEALCRRDPSVDRLWRGDRSAAPGDDESGSGFGLQLASALKRYGGFTPTEFGMLAWVWEMWSSLPDKADPRREIGRAWSRADGISAAADFADVELDPVEGGVISTARSKFLVHADDIAFDPKVDWLVRGWIRAGQFSLWYGPTNVGKSGIVMDLAWHVATGQPWGGADVGAAKPVLYISTEMAWLARNRVLAYRMAHSGDRPLLWLYDEPVDLFRSNESARQILDAMREIERDAGQPVAIVVLDVVSHSMPGGDENAMKDVLVVVRRIQGIIQKTGAHIAAVHHTGKDEGKGPRGSYGWSTNPETTIEVGNGTLRQVKQKGPQLKGHFRKNVVAIGADEEGHEVTTALFGKMSDAEVDFEMPDERLTPQEREAFGMFRDLELENDDGNVPWKDWRDALTRLLRNSKGEPIARQHANQIKARLLEKGLIEESGRGENKVVRFLFSQPAK